MLDDNSVKPKALPLSLLEDITRGFSADQEIGSGGFAVVYKVYMHGASVQILTTLYLKTQTSAISCE
jgi:hypothetical protein